MQPNQIVLAVDEGNDGVGLVDVTFNRFEVYQNRAVYIATDHTVATRHQLALFRSFPKANGNFKGTQKTAIKVTHDATVVGVDGSNIVAPIIAEVSFSLPVGVTAAQSMIIRQKLLALLDRDDIMAPLNDQLMV